MTGHVERAGWLGLAAGMVAGLALADVLDPDPAPVPNGTAPPCDELTQVVVFTGAEPGHGEPAVCVARWRVLVP